MSGPQDREAREGINTQQIKNRCIISCFCLKVYACAPTSHTTICQEPNTCTHPHTHRLVRMHLEHKKPSCHRPRVFCIVILTKLVVFPCRISQTGPPCFSWHQRVSAFIQDSVISAERAAARLQQAAVIDLVRFDEELSDFSPRDATYDQPSSQASVLKGGALWTLICG